MNPLEWILINILLLWGILFLILMIKDNSFVNPEREKKMNKWETKENGIINKGTTTMNEKEFRKTLEDGVKLKFVKAKREEEKNE